MTADHRNNSRLQAAKFGAAPTGQAMVIMTGPWRSSMGMSADGGADSGATISGNAMNSPVLADGALPSRASCPPVHDVGIDAVRYRHLGHRRPGLVARGHLLGLHRGAVPPPGVRLLACHRVHLRYADTILAAASGCFQDDFARRIRFSQGTGPFCLGPSVACSAPAVQPDGHGRRA